MLKTILIIFLGGQTFFTKRLLDITPLLLLARVDGKSPVEYFKVKQQEITRQLGKHILITEVKTLEQLYLILDNYVVKKITNVIGRMVFDSRGYPTVEAEVQVNNNFYGASIHLQVPLKEKKKH